MTENTAAATGHHTVEGRPNGSSSLTPHIVVTPARAAIEFYRDVFGAEVDSVTEMGGMVAHAELGFPLGRLTLGEPMADYGLVAPDAGAPVVYSLAIYVTDTDSVVVRAMAAGATIREEATTFVSGDRFASILDPFGVRWSVMTRVEDLSPEESERRVAEWAANQSTTG